MQLGRCLNGFVIPLLNSLAKELAQRLLDVFQQVVHVFQSYTQSDSCVQHVHLLAFFVRERAVNGAGRMDGQCAIVEKIGGAMNKLKLVYHVETGRFALQVDGYHCTGRVAKLLFGQVVVGVVGQPHVVYALIWGNSCMLCANCSALAA